MALEQFFKNHLMKSFGIHTWLKFFGYVEESMQPIPRSVKKEKTKVGSPYLTFVDMLYL